MKITEKKQRRLRHYIEAPRRFLRRARDLYVDSLITFDSKVGVITANTNHHSMNRSYNGKEEMCRLRYSSVELDRVGCFRERGSNGYGVIDRSYSVALGKIGTIDEDEQCEFQENVSHHMFLRTRSHAVTTNYSY